MALVPNPDWALSDSLVDCLPGGFLYDDVVAQSSSARSTSAPAPTSANTKAEIIAWLLDNGVTLSEPALSNLTKAELLDLVADVQDG